MPYINGYLGRIVKDPELKQTSSGKQTCNFTVASEKGWGQNKKTDFIPCVAWEKTAHTITTYFDKGDNIIVQGEWENNPWQKNEKGYYIPNWKYVVRSIVFIPKAKAKDTDDDEYNPVTQISGVNGSNESSGMEFAPIEGELEDLPFDLGLAYPQ